MSDALGTELVGRLREIAARAPVPLEIPPRVFFLLGGRFTHYDHERAALTARFPVKADYRNPLGFMQGGMIVAAADNTMGPLCFLQEFLGVSTQINSTFVRPVTPADDEIEVVARVVERTTTLAQVAATVSNASGKTVVLCQATFALARP